MSKTTSNESNSKIKPKKILFLFPYPLGEAPSQRFRFEQYLHFLQEHDTKKNTIQYDTQGFLDEKTWKILYKKGHYFQKIIGILFGFLRRIKILFFLKKYDFVFVHREATPLGYPFVEWWISKIAGKKMIFDYDDAIWLPNTSHQNRIVAGLKFHSKTALICKWAYKVSAGNQYLMAYAKENQEKKKQTQEELLKNIIYNPTTIDTENWHNPALLPKKNPQQKFTIGWTGTHSTLFYLKEILPILDILAEKYEFDFLVISNQKPDFEHKHLVFKTWQKETEIQDLYQMHVGIMPLADDIWAKGKCGFKALQYMALGIVPVVSPVGVNTEIVQHEKNGFVCQNLASWASTLAHILENHTKNPFYFESISQEARKTIVDKYSILSNKKNFLQLFY